MKIGHLIAYPDGTLQFENCQDAAGNDEYDDNKFMRRSILAGSRTLGDRTHSEARSNQGSKFRRSQIGDIANKDGDNMTLDKRSTSLYSSVRVNKGGFSRVSKGTSVMTPFTNVGGEPSRYGGRNRTLKQWYEGKAFNPGSKNMGYALNKRELGMNATEIYSQFSKQGHDEMFESMRKSTNYSQTQEDEEML